MCSSFGSRVRVRGRYSSNSVDDSTRRNFVPAGGLVAVSSRVPPTQDRFLVTQTNSRPPCSAISSDAASETTRRIVPNDASKAADPPVFLTEGVRTFAREIWTRGGIA